MKITVSQLRSIIKEEITKVKRTALHEAPRDPRRSLDARRPPARRKAKVKGSLSDWLADNFSSFDQGYDEYDETDQDALWMAACEAFGEDCEQDGTPFSDEFWNWINTHT